MSDTLTRIEFRPVVVPESVDSADAADLLEVARIRNVVLREISGHDDNSVPADELLPNLKTTDYRAIKLWLVVDRGEPVGRILIELPSASGSKVAFFRIDLLRDVWARGIGSAAYELVERTAREHDRTILQPWVEHPAAPGPRIAAPTGFGDIPEDHSARFLLRHGFTLEQVERNSAFDLTAPFDTVERLLSEAANAAVGYSVVQWFAPTPPEYVDGYAWMKSRMPTDAPAAELQYDEEVWDAARVAEHDSRYVDSGRIIQVTAAQHEASGELVAFSELVIGKDPAAASWQEDTLVLKGHRGHKLGTLVKCAGLISWRAVAPQSPRVITFNAEENRPMLDINEAIGFAPVTYIGAWKKVLE